MQGQPQWVGNPLDASCKACGLSTWKERILKLCSWLLEVAFEQLAAPNALPHGHPGLPQEQVQLSDGHPPEGLQRVRHLAGHCALDTYKHKIFIFLFFSINTS